jgi:Uri superfamily endonuclease
VLYIGSTCSSLQKYLSKFKKESKTRRNWRYDNFYNMIHFNNVNIELIENFPCDNANDLICKKNEVIDTVINEIKKIV